MAVVVAGALVASFVFLPAIEKLLYTTSVTSGYDSPVHAEAPAPWDEQLYVAYASTVSGLVFNITAVPQNGSHGYGPAYLVNGLAASGNWYQVGIAFDWSVTGGYLPGFVFAYAVWAPGHALIEENVTPMDVSSGDLVQVSLTIVTGAVVMTATDPHTGATESISYSDAGAVDFTGSPTGQLEQGYFTGPMTEWYHAHPYYGGESSVTYTSSSPFPTNVTLEIDEQNTSNGQMLFSDSEAVDPSCGCMPGLTYQGVTEQLNASEVTTS